MLFTVALFVETTGKKKKKKKKKKIIWVPINEGYWMKFRTQKYYNKITADGDCSHEIKRPLLLGRKAMTNLDSILKQRHYFANKDPSSQSYGFSSGHVWMWELDHKEGWTLKNWCFWAVVLNKTLENPLDWKEIKPVNPKGNQSWIFIRRTDSEKSSYTLAT